MNPIYQAMGGMNSPLGNINQMRQMYQQFRQSTQGDPQQIIGQMLQSGRINQATLDRAQMLAQQFKSYLQ